jgi:hypothetical protein
MQTTIRSSRRRKREAYRKMHGNPWDSSSSSRNKTMSLKKSSRRSNKKTVSFREPIVRSRSQSSRSKSSSHAAWRSVSSKK